MNIFASLDANLQPYELTGTATLYWKQQQDGSFERQDHMAAVSDVAGWNAAALALNRIQTVTVADPPSGQVIQSITLTASSSGDITATPTYAAASAPPVPEAVSRMQLRRQLLKMARTDGQTSAGGLRDQIDAYIAGSGNLDLIEYWNETSDFHRHHPAVEALLSTFSVTDAQADAAWLAASQLT